MSGPASPGDVGGWFRTARSGAALPTRDAWGPGTGRFGLESPPSELQAALKLLTGRRVLVLTGAGMSTGSGLPDYRGPDAVPRSPMLYSEFVGSDLSRRRYWARSTVGWRHFRSARPGLAHHALVTLSERLNFAGVITQNVDGLHQAAGLSRVIELHGSLAHVICLGCGKLSDRETLQRRLLAMNPAFARRLDMLSIDAASAPDGDAEVDRTDSFRYPACAACGGILKPDVVFFGENAPKATVDAAFQLLAESDALLVLGSSLTVMGGLRFVRAAVREEKPTVIAGDGDTRGDDLATLRIRGKLEDILPAWNALHHV